MKATTTDGREIELQPDTVNGLKMRLRGPVLVPGDASMLGQYLNVELTGTTGSTFTGAVCHTRQRTPLPMAG